MSVERETDDKNRVQTVKMSLSSPPAISLSRNLNTEMRMTWRTDRPTGGFVASEAVQVQTLVKSTKTWEEHFRLHGAILELVSIAGWRPFGFSNVEVQLSVDRVKVSPTAYGEPRWLKVVDHRLPKQPEPIGDVKFLFPYREIGPRGIKRWLKLRDEYDRAIGALLSILRSDDPWSIPSVVQRFWIGLHLGVRPATLLDRLNSDPYRSPFRVVA
jgi:hypothetical protein